MKSKQGLNRVVSVHGLSANIINIVVGSGIYVLPAIVAASLGSASILAYLFCGFLIALVMLCFAEAGSRLTDSGGAYIYIKSAFGDYFGFLTAVLFILGAASADAAVANAIVGILSSVLPVVESSVVRFVIFILLFAGFAGLHVRGVREGVKVVKLITVTKLIPLILLVLFSVPFLSMENLSIDVLPQFGEVATISLVLFFAFQGAESGLSISGEIKNPKRNIPKAIFISIGTILLLYILVQSAAQGVLGATLVNFKENPLGALASELYGPVGLTIMTVAGAVSILGYLSSAILSMPRVLYQASKDKVIPFDVLTSIHPRFHTPYVAIIGYALVGFLFASFGGFEQLAIIASATILLIYLGVSLSVIKMRMSHQPVQDAFRIPGGYTVPILSCITIVFLLSNLAQKEFIFIAVAILLLTVVYFIKRLRT